VKKGLTLLGIFVLLIAVSSFTNEPEKITKEQLGEMLFSDPILSENLTISCASCHKPEFAFADTVAFSTGVHGRKGFRNTPSVMNMASREAFFWDGRAATLEEQALFPIQDVNEMNLPVDSAVKRLTLSNKYATLFQQVFNQLPTSSNLGAALAAFQKTLETGNTPNDRWLNDVPDGLTPQQERGRQVFRVKGKCFECHFTPDFTADEFRSIGLFNGMEHNDSGRYLVTRDPADLGKFKVPGLRNVAMTAPYMHDGSFQTLRQVIDYYNNPHSSLPTGMNRDTVLRDPLNLTEQEKQDLESFLHSLTDDRFTNRK